MNVSTEKLENNKVALTITVPQADVAKAFDQAWRRICAKLSIPGFRKGKAPRKIIEQRVGLPAIKEEAFEALAQTAYRGALDETGILPVSRPDIDVDTIEEDKDMVFKATVTVCPEVTLGQYKDLFAERPLKEIGDADVDEILNRLRNQKAVMTVAEGALMNGDFAMIDFAGTVDGQPFQGGEGKSYPLEIGSNSFIPGFEAQLIGAAAGEERLIKVTFPAEYFVKELAGKDAEFKVTVNDVKRKQLPEASDEFIRENSEFETLLAWRDDCRDNLIKAAALSDKNAYEDKIVRLAVDNASIDIPDVMADDRVSERIGDMMENMRRRGLKFDDYLKYAGKTLEELREAYRPGAIADIKSELVMEKIAEQENIEAEDADIDEEISQMSAQYNKTPQEIKKNLIRTGNIFMVKAFIRRRKAALFIINNAARQAS